MRKSGFDHFQITFDIRHFLDPMCRRRNGTQIECTAESVNRTQTPLRTSYVFVSYAVFLRATSNSSHALTIICTGLLAELLCVRVCECMCMVNAAQQNRT